MPRRRAHVVSSKLTLNGKMSVITNKGSIIFVHGLGSNPDTTWRAERCATTPDTPCLESERYVNWVSDFLPDDLCSDTNQDIRLFYYNHDSYWKRDALPERLNTFGHKLLGWLHNNTRGSDVV